MEKVRAYNPKEYRFLGLFLTLIPVFVMSFSNSKVLPNGEMIRKRMKIFLAVFVLLLAVDFGLLVWATHSVTQSLKTAMKTDSSLVMEVIIRGEKSARLNSFLDRESQFAKTVLDSASYVLFGLNLLLLTIATRFTNKHELPAFQKLKDDGEIQHRRLLIPVLSGMAFIALVYFGLNPALEAVVRLSF